MTMIGHIELSRICGAQAMNDLLEYIKYLEVEAEKHRIAKETYISNRMFSDAGDELRCIRAIKEKLTENRIRNKFLVG